MWTEITRPKYERDLLRYASDLTDGEWKVLEPLLPSRQSAGTASDDGITRGGERDPLPTA